MRPITYSQKSRLSLRKSQVSRKASTQQDISNITLEEYIRSQLSGTPTASARIFPSQLTELNQGLAGKQSRAYLSRPAANN